MFVIRHICTKEKLWFKNYCTLLEGVQGGLESGGKDNAKQTNECLLRAI